MEDNVHEVVKLLLGRMESHPEEFAAGSSRWGWMIENVMEHCSKEEAEAIKEGLRPIRMQEIHEYVMDELRNGEERRAQEQRERDLEAQRLMGRVQAKAYANLSQYQNAIGIGTATPSQPLTLQSSGKEPLRIGSGGELQIGGQTLDESLISNIRRKLGL